MVGLAPEYDALDMIEYAQARDYQHMMARRMFKCQECDEWILEDDPYYEVCGFKVCKQCIEDSLRYA